MIDGRRPYETNNHSSASQNGHLISPVEPEKHSNGNAASPNPLSKDEADGIWTTTADSDGDGTSPHRSEMSNNRKSVMREFLESKDDSFKFRWPNGSSHYDFGKGHDQWIIFQRRLRDPSEEGNSFVNEYLGEPRVGFKKLFAVKNFKFDTQSATMINKAVNEVEINQCLCHPHCTAFLGTFIAQTRLNLMIYPAACGDLRNFLSRICKDRHELFGMDIDQGLESTVSIQSVLHHVGRDARDRPPSLPGNKIPELAAILQGSDEIEVGENPFEIGLSSKTKLVLGWFQCLASAVEYLHKTADIRHKDLKPENILVDASGMVLITDFGISRQFRPGVTHVTNDQWGASFEYASPEVMKGRRVQRGDPSDIFSLGCVFLEMVSVVLGKDLSHFQEFRTTEFNITIKSSAYHCNLPKVHSWIKDIDTHCQESEVNEKLTEPLATIRAMLSAEQNDRPKADELWDKFKDILSRRCVDCDKDSKTRWRPTDAQMEKTESAKAKRQSLLMVPGTGTTLTHELTKLSGITEEGKQTVETTDFAVDTLPDFPGIQDNEDSKIPTLLLRRPTPLVNNSNTSLNSARQTRSRSPPISRPPMHRQSSIRNVQRKNTDRTNPVPEDAKTRRSSPPLTSSPIVSSSEVNQPPPNLPLRTRVTTVSQHSRPPYTQNSSTTTDASNFQESIDSSTSLAKDSQALALASSPTPVPEPRPTPVSAPLHISFNRQLTPPYKLPKDKKIITYDSQRTELRVMEYDIAVRLVSSEGRVFKWQTIPSKGRTINVTDEYGEPIAKMDLTKLKQVCWWKSWRRSYPRIFIIL